jgi:hypothetical protein
MSGHPGHDQLDTDIGDAFGEVFGQMMENFEAVARRFSLPPFERRARATAQGSGPDGAPARAGRTATAAGSPDTVHDAPPAITGGHRAGEVTREPTLATPSGR